MLHQQHASNISNVNFIKRLDAKCTLYGGSAREQTQRKVCHCSVEEGNLHRWFLTCDILLTMNDTSEESVDVLVSYDDFNYTYSYQDSLDWLPLNELVPCVTFYVIIGLLGITGNSLVIIVILALPRTRNITNLFLLSLASADLLLVLVCVPIKVDHSTIFKYNSATYDSRVSMKKDRINTHSITPLKKVAFWYFYLVWRLFSKILLIVTVLEMLIFFKTVIS